jgi:hypothetical protein
MKIFTKFVGSFSDERVCRTALFMRDGFLVAAVIALSVASAAAADAGMSASFVRLRDIQFIAALGDPGSSSGTGANECNPARENQTLLPSCCLCVC